MARPFFLRGIWVSILVGLRGWGNAVAPCGVGGLLPGASQPSESGRAAGDALSLSPGRSMFIDPPYSSPLYIIVMRSGSKVDLD